MNQEKVILQNAKTQFEAQKQKVYKDAYDGKVAEMKADLDAYTAEKNQEYTQAITSLKAAYDAAVAEKRKTCDEAIAAKKAEVESTASIFASKKVAVTENYISKLEEMIAGMED